MRLASGGALRISIAKAPSRRQKNESVTENKSVAGSSFPFPQPPRTSWYWVAFSCQNRCFVLESPQLPIQTQGR